MIGPVEILINFNFPTVICLVIFIVSVSSKEMRQSGKSWLFGLQFGSLSTALFYFLFSIILLLLLKFACEAELIIGAFFLLVIGVPFITILLVSSYRSKHNKKLNTIQIGSFIMFYLLLGSLPFLITFVLPQAPVR